MSYRLNFLAIAAVLLVLLLLVIFPQIVLAPLKWLGR